MKIQLEKLKYPFDRMQLIYGSPDLRSVYGAGCVRNPQVMLVFMNPTAKNISAQNSWSGIRAPWIGTKNAWRFFFKIGILSKKQLDRIENLKANEWSPYFAENLFKDIAGKRVYVTNLAKCTQSDARALPDSVFREYRDLMLEEINLVRPRFIVTFGNQVSSVLLNRPISVSNFLGDKKEALNIGPCSFEVCPVHYPVGQGMRNMPIAAKRVRRFLNK